MGEADTEAHNVPEIINIDKIRYRGMLMKTVAKIEVLKRMILLITIVCVIGSSVYVILNGAVCDLALLTTFRLKAFNGDLPMKSIYGPYALSSWFLSGEYHILHWLFKSNEYGILLTKIMGVLFQFCVAGYFVFHETRKGHEKQRTVLCALIFFLFLPDYLYCFVSHYNVIYWMTLLLVLVLSETNDTYLKYICSAVFLCMSILANPTAILLFIVILVYLIYRHTKIKYLLTFFSASAAIGVGVLGYLFSKNLQLTDILNLLKACSHDSGTADIWKKFILIAVLVFGVVAYHNVFKFIRTKLNLKYEFEILVGSLLLISLCVILFLPSKLINCMRCVYFVISLLGIWASVYGVRECPDKQTYPVYSICGITTALLCGLFTNTGIMICSIGMVIPVIGYLHLRASESHIIIFILIFIILGQRMILIDGGQYCTGFDCKYTVETGIMKGIRVTESNYERYHYLQNIVHQYVDDDDKILYISDATDSYMYSMSGADICFPGNEFTAWDNEYYLDYFNHNSDKIPTKIVIVGVAYIERFDDSTNDEFIDYVRENYQVVERTEEIMVLQ